jgi:hypothetical protein
MSKINFKKLKYIYIIIMHLQTKNSLKINIYHNSNMVKIMVSFLFHNHKSSPPTLFGIIGEQSFFKKTHFTSS